MAKNILKIVFFILLFVSVLLVPIVGVYFYDSPSIFDEGAIVKGHDFGNGSNVVLNYTAEEDGKLSVEEAAKIIENRFKDVGYPDPVCKVSDGKIVLSLPLLNSVEDIISEVCVNGKWGLTDLNGGDEFINETYIEKAELKASNGYYFLAVTVKEDKRSEIKSSVYYIANSGAAYAYLSMDGENQAFVQVSSSMYSEKTGELLIAVNSSSITSLVPIFNYGPLQGEAKVESITKDYGAKIPAGTQKIIFISLTAVLVVLALSLVFVNKNYGWGAAMAVIANAAVLLTSAANKGFVFNVTSLIIMACAVLASWLLNLYVLIKAKNTKIGRLNIDSVWMHLAAFVVTVVLWIVSKGILLTIGNIFMTATVASFITYFVFTFAFSWAMKKKAN